MAEGWMSFYTIVPLLFVAHLVLPRILAEECGPVNHDISVLKKRPYWEFEVPAPINRCPHYEVEAKNSSCIFYFSICHDVPGYCPEGSGICLANKVFLAKVKNTTWYTRFINIGSKSKEKFTSGENHFTLQYGAGELFSATQLKFQCNKSAKWDDLKDDDKINRFLVMINDTYEFGEYLIVFDYSGACDHGGGGGGGGGGDDGSKDDLSVGSILLILFFPGIFLYCVVGALINKGAGKSGKEVIPNAKFWSNLPGLISDGFSFFIAKITCSQMSTTPERYDRM